MVFKVWGAYLFSNFSNILYILLGWPQCGFSAMEQTESQYRKCFTYYTKFAISLCFYYVIGVLISRQGRIMVLVCNSFSLLSYAEQGIDLEEFFRSTAGMVYISLVLVPTTQFLPIFHQFNSLIAAYHCCPQTLKSSPQFNSNKKFCVVSFIP